MSVYFLMVGLTLFFAHIAENLPNRKKLKNGSVIYRPSSVFAFFVFLTLACLYAFRYYVGTDFGGYYHSYQRIVDQSETLETFMDRQRDMLFGYIEYYCAVITGGNWLIFSFLCAALTYLPVIITIRKKSVDFSASVLLFVFTMQYFSTFNGVRQAIAVGLTFYAYYCCFKEKRYFKYALVVALAFGFHSTALIVIPVHLLSLKPLRSKLIWITVGVLVLSFLFLDSVWKYVISFLEDIGQSKLASDYETLSGNGSGILRLIVAMLPPIVGVICQRQLRAEHSDTEAETILLMICAIFSMFSLNTWIFSRIAEYFKTSLILFLPKLPSIFNKKSRPFIRLCLLALYCGYMCAMLLHGDGHLLPYKWIFDA